MRFIKLASRKWTVLIYSRLKPDGKDECPVLDFLIKLKDKRLAKKMLALLIEYVPKLETVEDFKNERISKKLELEGNDSLFEFRRGKKFGNELRVCYFFDKGQIVICVEAFTKTNKTPKQSIERAVELEARYTRIITGTSNEERVVVELKDTNYKDIKLQLCMEEEE
jgi:hypothetical protein